MTSTIQYFNSFCPHIVKHITGIIHVGAHMCEERDTYLELFRQTDESILWIEADESIVHENKAQYPSICMIHACCSDHDNQGTFYFSNFSRCHTLLPFTEQHTSAFPSILQHESKVQHNKLDTIISKEDKPKRNMLFVSVNGGELQVLKGAETLLEFIDFLIVKHEKYPFHTSSSTRNELNDWLGMNGFTKVESIDDSHAYEVLFYVGIDAYDLIKNKDKRMTDELQLMIEEYNSKHNTNVVTQVFDD